MNVPTRQEARYYECTEWESVSCHVCPHACSIAPSRSGVCGVRSNRGGKLYVDGYGRVASTAIVPAATLPMFHFAPDSRWLLVGMKGCDMRCPFCNTYKFSQTGGVRTVSITPTELVAKAQEGGALGIAFGINEPAISHEFVVDCFNAARKAGLQTFLQTNGMWSADPFREVGALTNALTLGLKGFDADFLIRDCGGTLDFIRNTFEIAVGMKIHCEVTYLVLEDEASAWEQLAAFAEWLATIDSNIPVHLLPLKPDFLWKREATSSETMRRAFAQIGDRLPWVYVHHEAVQQLDTRCSQCNRTLIRRNADVGTILADDARTQCPGCGARVPFDFPI